MKYLLAPLLLALCTGACSDGAQDDAAAPSGDISAIDVEGTGETGASAPATQPVLRDEWVGRWIGVEGLNLTIAKGAEAGHYQLDMQYGTDADMAGSYDGVGTADGIAFTRPDGTQLLRAASGDETGLKYLAGKTDCLKVKDGEGYCRD